MANHLRAALRGPALRGPALRGPALRGPALLSAAALLAAGCGSARPPQQRQQRQGQQRPIASRGVAAREPAANARLYGAADSSFGLDVLGAWCRQDPQANIVFSPESLASGLGMAYLGARGQTASAIARVLHLPAAGRTLLAGLQARSAGLRALDGPGVTVAGSDQVWADPALPTLRGYLDDVATGYGAGLRQVPLLSDPARAAGQIDASIAAATRGHITRLLTARDLQGIGWVLTDAVYLNARWASPFQHGQTSPGRFTTASGQQVSASFLTGDGYVSDRADGWTAVSLPYRGGRLSMTALLPDSGAGGCPALSEPALARIGSALARGSKAGRVTGPGGRSAGTSVIRSTAVALPKVSLSSKATMNGLLSKLGMGIAFSQGADFSGLSPQAASIGSVTHAAALQVGESGTAASAATAVTFYPVAARAVLRTVTFDRPYLLVVTDTATGEPLFLARVADPLTS